jgi:hypothetical protein
LEFDEVLIKGEAAIGKRLSTRTVRRISELTVKVSEKQDHSEPEQKCEEVNENLPPSPESAHTSIREENGDDKQAAAVENKAQSQLGLFDLKKKE